jgi:RHS repeat-associated protein
LKENMYITKDGYMETFVVNETSEDVWFDNLMVSSVSSAIVQETHYDPWGLELTGLGYQYGGIKANKYLYNGKEHLIDLNLNLYDYGARFLDPAIGRWISSDPLADHPKQIGMSPYSGMWNNPIRWNDPDGMMPCCGGGTRPAVRNSPRVANVTNVRRVVSQMSKMHNSGIATIGRIEGALMKTQRFHTASRGDGTNRSGLTSFSIGTPENFDNTHSFGNTGGNLAKMLGDILQSAQTITKNESFAEVNGFEVSLGADYFVDDYSTTKALKGLQEDWESGVRDRAMGGMSAEEFEQLPIEDQNMKLGLSRVLSGPSPLSVIENMLRGKKPDEVEVRRNDVVRPGN